MDVTVLGKIWDRYFPDEEAESFDPVGDMRVAAVRSFYDFLRDNQQALKLDLLRIESELRSFHFNFNDLMELSEDTPIHDLPEALRQHPLETLNCLGLAVCVLRVKLFGVPVSLVRHIHMRIHAVQPYQPFSTIRANSVKKLVSIRGTALRVSPVRPLVRCMYWLCASCGADIKRVRDVLRNCRSTFLHPCLTWLKTTIHAFDLVADRRKIRGTKEMSRSGLSIKKIYSKS